MLVIFYIGEILARSALIVMMAVMHESVHQRAREQRQVRQDARS